MATNHNPKSRGSATAESRGGSWCGAKSARLLPWGKPAKKLRNDLLPANVNTKHSNEKLSHGGDE